jgi:ketosteroid isomerase-like protein
MSLVATVAAILFVAAPLGARDYERVTFVLPVARALSQTQSANDSADIVGTVTRFHDALASGDSAAALALLAPDVVILESGDVERRDDYRSHHLPADIAFARAIHGLTTLVGVSVVGDAAWVSATTITTGQFNGRAINSAGAELVVLARARRQSEPESSTSRSAPWRIRAIHWSSHRRTP